MSRIAMHRDESIDAYIIYCSIIAFSEGRVRLEFLHCSMTNIKVPRIHINVIGTFYFILDYRD